MYSCCGEWQEWLAAAKKRLASSFPQGFKVQQVDDAACNVVLESDSTSATVSVALGASDVDVAAMTVMNGRSVVWRMRHWRRGTGLRELAPWHGVGEDISGLVFGQTRIVK